ncbi:MAG: M48 family metallopeptidase [Candidatus Omnitrophota bacterium]|nr:M48 family metallopeptidase [Candidatus Omnitrophota bacterium]
MRYSKRLFSAVLFLAAAFFLTGCAAVYNTATGRKEYVIIGTRQETALGRNLDKQILRKYKASGDEVMGGRLEAIGRRIADASDRQDIEHTFKVVESDDINAFTIPGGYIYATTGLMSAASSDDELAGVMAHEAGHVAARHSIKRLEASLGYSILSQIAFFFARPDSASEVERIRNIKKATNTIYRLIELGYSRQDEMLADSLALRYTKKAGYDPVALLTFMEKLLEKEQPASEWLVFMRSHPHTKQRIEAIKKQLEEDGFALYNYN